MKRYRIKRYDKSSPYFLIELSKSESLDGERIMFLENGKKFWQYKYKNGFLNGVARSFYFYVILNNKKGKRQGIEIIYKKTNK